MKSVFDIYYGLMGTVNPDDWGPDCELPAEEESCGERLCRHPLVSVLMTVYNHERWVAEAIEGVVAQQTDFEYELLIGDDASTDGSAAICRDYLRRYPDRIRFITSGENLFRTGGNARRLKRLARGAYFAFCEGDDFWTDPRKLQKQLDLIRRTGSVACVALHENLLPDGRRMPCSPVRADFADLESLRKDYYHTSTQVISREVFSAYPGIRRWYDSVMLACAAGFGRMCVLPETVSCYRQTGEGIWTGLGGVRRNMLSVEPVLRLYRYGPADGGSRAYLAAEVLERIRSSFKYRDAASIAYLQEHGAELISLYREFYRQLPFGLKIRFFDAWLKGLKLKVPKKPEEVKEPQK